MAFGLVDLVYVLIEVVITNNPGVTCKWLHENMIDEFRNATVQAWSKNAFYMKDESNVRNGTNGILGRGGKYGTSHFVNGVLKQRHLFQHNKQALFNEVDNYLNNNPPNKVRYLIQWRQVNTTPSYKNKKN
jgi:hypothetical protein